MTAIGELSLRWFRGESAGGELTQAPGRAQAGEIDLAPLVEAWSPLLFRIAHSVVRSRAEAEDVVQDTFLRVLEHRHKLPEVRDLRVWLLRIAWNLALDRRRRIRPEQMADGFAGTLHSQEVPADRALAGVGEIHRALAALDELPAAEREALLLSAFEELSTAEIAAVLGRSEGAVRALLSRARVRLRQRLQAPGTQAVRRGKEER